MQIGIYLSIVALVYSKFHSLPYSQINGVYNLNLYIGTPKVFRYFEIDLKTPYNLMNIYTYDKNKSRAIKYIDNSSTIDDNVPYEILSDQLLLNCENDILINNFYFLYSHKPVRKYDFLSFAYKIKDPRLSLVHLLKEANEISNLSFGLAPSPFNTGTMYLGGFPEDLYKNSYKTSFTVDDEYESWGCQVNKVYIGDHIQYHSLEKEYGYFQTNDDSIIVPPKFMELLKTTFFNKYVDNKQCTFIHILDKLVFECNCNIMKSFPKLIFEFGKNERKNITLNNEFIKNSIGINCNVLIKSNLYSNNIWQFGIPFLKSYPILFDYEKKSFTLYSTDQFGNNRRLTNHQLMMFLFLYIFVLNIIMICLLFFCQKKIAFFEKKHRNVNLLEKV